MADSGEVSKSAKKRANKKAREEAEAEAAAPPPPPVAEPKGKAKAKAKPEAKAEPKAEAKAKAKSEPKAEAKAEPKAKGKAKAEPKAATAEPKAKAKAEPKAATAPEPKAEPKAAGKAKSKAKAKAQPKQEEVVEPVKEELINFVIDDGGGGDWEVSTGLSSKAAKKQAKEAAAKAEKEMMKQAAGGLLPKNTVPGMGPLDPRQAAANKAGNSQAASADVARILATKEEAVAAAANVAVATVNVPDNKIGIVIGPGGLTIKTIQEKTKVTRIDTAGGVFTITGGGSAVAEAEAAIKELITKGFCSILYEDFAENSLSVHPSYFPDIIGKGGCIIQQIKKQLKVEVGIPQGVDSKSSKKHKVTLAGSAKQVEEAKEVINSIMMYSHHEITHPGLCHEEIEIENWNLKYIIGSKGSEMKHIQKNWDVKLSIPREHSVNQKVLIVGEQSNVERAKLYVEKVLWNAENQVKGGRDKVDDGDAWGEEDADEPWMKDYIYRR